jgi:prefoldin subunit 4
MRKGENADEDVTWEEQKKINRFSLINVQHTRVADEIAQLNKVVEELDDARMELELLALEDGVCDDDDEITALEADLLGISTDENPKNLTSTKESLAIKSLNTIRYRVGECFIHMSPSEALAQVEKDLDDTKKLLSEIQIKAESYKNEMSNLKAALYSRFKNSINLEGY